MATRCKKAVTFLLPACSGALTTVNMSGRQDENAASMQGWRHWSKGLGAATLVAALAALAIPGPAGEITGIASVLAVGAIAVLAEHAWGLLLVAIADVLLVGKVWPALA